MIAPLAASFRDPSGFVFQHDGLYYRAIMHEYKDTYEHLINSGLYQSLVNKRLLIAHQEVELPFEFETPVYKTLLPDQLGFLTYPYEWCFAQWKAVVQAFLEINTLALEYGMILKDATPFNFTFYKGKVIFFDTPSFSIYNEGDLWIAYRQFCESLLGPLALIKYNGDSWSAQFTNFISGIPLPYISQELSWRSYMDTAILLHIHFHARQHSKRIQESSVKAGLSKEKLQILFEMLMKAISKWYLKSPAKTAWQNYYSDQMINQEYLQLKEETVENWLSELPASSVLVDLGANNGRFAKMGTKYYSEVIAIEPDAGCVNDLYHEIETMNLVNLKVAQVNLMQPSPGAGWNNTEREPLIHRLKGDTILALALIHHLCIVNNLPIESFASFIASITRKYAIVEFIPKSDPMVAEMLSVREDVFHSYQQDNFIYSFEQHFTLVKVNELNATGRILFLWEKK